MAQAIRRLMSKWQSAESAPAVSAVQPPLEPDATQLPPDMQVMLDRLIERIRQAPIDSVPSDNIYMEDLFEPEFYRQILAHLPRDADFDFIDHPDAVLPDGRKTRKLLDLSEESLLRLTPESQAFWRGMNDMLRSTALVNAVTTKFYKTIQARFGVQWPKMVLVPVFYRDYPGYRIGVHTDVLSKVATLQLYLPKDESQIHLGTSFHTKGDKGFELYKTNSFKPNSGYAFVRTDRSWHSVQQLGPNETVRDSLALTLFLDGWQYKSKGRYV